MVPSAVVWQAMIYLMIEARDELLRVSPFNPAYLHLEKRAVG
jgi:hypothetical protein